MVTITTENKCITINLDGRIDSTNAPVLEKEIWDQVDFSNCDSIIVNAENLIMISSAGLRVILKMRKLCANLKVIETNTDVYDVFEMTGFTEMMKVEKAFRKLSVDGCEKLGEGSNGIVYRYNPEIVVKVYKNANALKEIEKEKILARKALILGIPTAISFDVVKVGNTYGSVFELLKAKSFSNLISEEPENTDKYIRMFVDLLLKIHSTQVDHEDLDDMKARAISWVEYLKEHLPQDQYDKLHSLVTNTPNRDTMIHGDYHTNNVEMENGEVLLIDMDTLAFGHPIFELGSMYISFIGFADADETAIEKFMGIPLTTTKYIWRKSLELYLGTTDEKRIESVEEKAKIIGYARMLRRTIKRIGFEDPIGKVLIQKCKENLATLLPKVDSLDF